MFPRARLLSVAVAAVLLGCGGPGSAPTQWQDDGDRKGFAPEGGEDSAVVMDFPAGTTLEGVTYSKDPDLALVRFDAATGNSTTDYSLYYLVRVGARTATPYCGKVKFRDPFLPIEPDVSTAAIGLVGEDLVFFSPVVQSSAFDARVVCAKGAGGEDLGSVRSATAIPAPYVSNGPSKLMRALSADGFWTTGRDATGAAVMEVRYDGTLNAIPFDSTQDSGHRFDLARGAFYFVAGGDVKRLDLATKATTTLATGVGATSIVAADAQGVLVKTGSGAAVVRLTAGVVTLTGVSGLDVGGSTLAFESGGGGLIVGTERYDTATGQPFTVTLAADLAVNALQYRRQFTRSGHVYLFGPSTDPLDVWVASLAANTPVTFSRGSPSYRLDLYAPKPELNHDAYFSSQPLLYGFADGSCLLFTGGTQAGASDGPPKAAGLKGTAEDLKQAGAIWPVAGRRGVSWSRCGESSATVLALSGGGRSQGFESFALGGESARDDAPYFTQNYLKVRAEKREPVGLEPGSGYWDHLESGWTVTGTGKVVPLFKLAEHAYPRAHSLDNFLLHREQKLVLAKGHRP